jgi:hypothetical protein
VLINMGRTRVCMGHVPSALLPVGYDDDGGLYEHQGQLLAARGAYATPTSTCRGTVLSISTTIMMACCLMIMSAAIWRVDARAHRTDSAAGAR